MPIVKSWLAGIFDDIEFFEFGSSTTEIIEMCEVVTDTCCLPSYISYIPVVLCKDYVFCSNAMCSLKHDYNRDFKARQRWLKKYGLNLQEQKIKLDNALNRFGSKVICRDY
jgi:hypothetical protein